MKERVFLDATKKLDSKQVAKKKITENEQQPDIDTHKNKPSAETEGHEQSSETLLKQAGILMGHLETIPSNQIKSFLLIKAWVRIHHYTQPLKLFVGKIYHQKHLS